MWEGDQEPFAINSNTFLNNSATFYAPDIGSLAYSATLIELT